MSGADLQNLMNQAALKASVEGKAAVEGEDLDYARDKILMGAERRTAVISPETARCTAYHEGGHALVALRTRGADPIHKATILPRGPSLGHVAFLPAGDQTSVSRQQMLAKLDVGMGGRAAEELVFGRDRVTSGAASDLQNATRVARAMVTQYGMSPAVGYTALDLDRASPEALATVDREVQRLLREAYGRAKALLASDRRGLERLAGALIQYETLNREEIEEVVRTGKVRGRKKKEQRRDGERKEEQPAAAQVTKTASTEEKGAEVTGDKKPQEPATAAAV
uniref:Peptidase M41 domain-containing protein n=2 Tax=Heterosigma akashiwo TaxID=2829 RepID=A0A7S4D875_HETAK